jgi:hypothetical protein
LVTGIGAADSVPTRWFGSDALNAVVGAAISGTVGSSQVSNYLGGGSGIGVSSMANRVAANAIQQAAPSTKMLTSAACSYNLPSPGNNGAFTTNANGIVIGLDALDVLASTTSGANAACTSPASDLVTSDGLAQSGSAVFGPSGNATAPNQNWKYILALVYGGLDLTTGTVDCNSTARKNLVANWSLLFQNGCTNANTVCSASVGITGTGDGIHAGQLVHAYRRDDGSATGDVFSSLIGLQAKYPAPSASSNNGFGASPFCNALNWDTSNVNNGGGFCNLGGHDQFVGPGGIPDPQSACTFFSFKATDLNGTSTTPNDTDPGCVAGTALNGVPATLAGVTGTVHRMPPPNTLGAVPLAGAHNGSDVLPTSFQDNDPIRRACLSTTGKTAASNTGGAAFSPGESVCNLDGKLGLVLAIPSSEFIPNSLHLKQYPTNKCTSFAIGAPTTYLTCAPFSPGVHNGECPNGDALNSAGCIIAVDTLNNTSQCISEKGPATVIHNDAARSCAAGQNCTTVGASLISSDERVFNLHPRDGGMTGQPQYIKQVIQNGSASGVTVNFAGGMGRIFSITTIFNGTIANPPNSGCQAVTADDQIGCLAQADPCSIGFTGDGSKTWAQRLNGNACDNLVAGGVCTGPTGGPYSGASCPAACTGASGVDALRIAGTYPTTTTVTSLGKQANEYEIARKLYYNSIVGFKFINAGSAGQTDTALGGELDVASWLSSAANENFILPTIGFFPLGNQSAAAFNTPFCEDFNELLNCGASAGSNAQNACNTNVGITVPVGAAGFTPNAGVAVPNDPSPAPGSATTSTVCGNGVVEAYEECDPGATATGSTATCSTTCRCAGALSYKQVGGIFGCN